MACGEEDAVAGQDERPLGLLDLLGREAELARDGPRSVGLKPGRSIVSGCWAARLARQRVLGDVDVDGPGAAGARDVEGLGDDARDVVRLADEVVVLGHRQRDAVMSISWKASLPMSAPGTLPVMATMGMESSCAVAMPVTRLVAPGPDVPRQTPTLPVARA